MVNKDLMAVICTVIGVGFHAIGATWYVDASGNDSNDGSSSSSAKATIQAAVDSAASGDEIIVSDGTYSPFDASGKVLTISSVSGCLVTIIDAQRNGRCVVLGSEGTNASPPSESSGNYDSELIGFTLRNGYIESADGGGVLGGTLRNCVIENCYGKNGGAGESARFYRCVLKGNQSYDDGGGVHRCIVYDSLIVNNTALNNPGGVSGSAASVSRLYNCTVVGNTSYKVGGALDYHMYAYNCIVWGNYRNDGTESNIYEATTANCYTNDPGFVDAANGDYRLTDDSPCIDAGENSYVAEDMDLAGRARIYNQTVDIGCYEWSGTSGDAEGGAIAHFAYDGRAGTREITGDQTFVYDAAWATNGVSAKIYDGSTLLVSGASGTYAWSSSNCGSINTLYLKIYDSTSTLLVAESASFSVEHITYTSKEATSATCTSPSMTAEISCSRCGEVVAAATVYEPPLGHSTYVSRAAEEATSTSPGYTAEIKCSRCGVIVQERQEILETTRTITYSPGSAEMVEVLIDGVTLLSSTNSGIFVWQPKATGTYTITYKTGTSVKTETVSVTGIAYATPESPNPPTEEDANITIGSTAKSVAATGGTASITTSGSGTWEGSVSDSSWLSFNGLSSKTAGQSAIVKVAANTDVEARTGYVYISGHVFTITQAGVGAELDEYSAEFGTEGGTGEILVLADGQSSWNVKAESDWISVNQVSGTGEAYVTYTVAPYAAVSDRAGYITVAGCTFEVHQIGRYLSISRKSDSFDYLAHAVEIDVSAYLDTEWFVNAAQSWVSVVDPAAGFANGGGKVALAINENPSYVARSGTVTIGTETYSFTQAGRPSAALEFAISPESTTASVNGANGLIAVTATPDLPWSAESGANWLTVMPSFKEGTGDGNVVYTVTPNSTMSDRTGKITVTPESTSGKSAKTHTVSQPAATAAIDVSSHTFAAAGDSFEVTVTTGDNVEWSIANSASWITIDGSSSRIGPGTVKITVAAISTLDTRSATVTIAGHAFTVNQRGRTVEVEYVSMVFDADGGEGTIDVHPDGTVEWTAVSSATWLTIWAEDGASDNADGSVSGTGDGTIGYYVDPYVGDGEALTATITIGDKIVYITQRAYACSISPSAATVAGNAGAGEFGFSASIDDVWDALEILCSKDWIETAQITSYDATTKSGTIRYTNAANDSGVARTGTIVVGGEAYVLSREAREIVEVGVEVEGSGTVSGDGEFDVGDTVTLTATAANGWEFAGWYDGQSCVATSLSMTFTASVDKTYTAKFSEIPTYVVNGASYRRGELVTFTAPADVIDEAGTTKLVCTGTSAFPTKGTSFSLSVSEDLAFEWDMWTTNYLVEVGVEVEGGNGGTVSATVGGDLRAPLPAWFAAGETVTLTATPASGSVFYRWTGDGEFVDSSIRSIRRFGEILPIEVTGPVKVTAVFGAAIDASDIAAAVGCTGLVFRTGGDGAWIAAVDAITTNGYSAAKATASANNDVWLETTVEGTGTFAFEWRTECERDDSGAAQWDRLAVFTNGVEAARIDGANGYRRVELPINGKTTIRWSFYRDEVDDSAAPSEPTAWLDGIEWTPEGGND